MTEESRLYPEREPVDIGMPAAEALAEVREEMGWSEGEPANPKTYRLKGGRVLTDADINAMADEMATDEWAEKSVEAIRQREIAGGMPPDMWLGDWLAATRDRGMIETLLSFPPEVRRAAIKRAEELAEAARLDED